ncbi:hypothetical protein EB796_012677 [Bugula neritina]|uniref:Arrestin C-terminal-like domain-containing protein n=1 Tax=Bugula neritina TaxID=10212 RepID=A0A7J7JSQ4_BUGNE|nr:hypothetical protein EB796_012677 [Bugula neritina]
MTSPFHLDVMYRVLFLISGLRVIIEGFVRVSDTKKVVLSSNKLLYGPEKGRKVQEKTNVGTYKYPFSIDLPEDLPTTIFKSELLKASYKCMAILIRKQPSDDVVVERPFIVHSVTDCIYNQVALGQACSEKTLQFNSLSALISLPKTGFYLGQKLVVGGVVENPTSSSRKVKVGIRVVRTIVGHGALEFGLIKINQTKSNVTVVTDRWSNFFKVPKKSSEEFEVDIPLNLMEPTTKHDLIDIEYLAYVSFITQGVLSDSKTKSATFSITIAPPRTLSQYPPSYALQAPSQSYQEFQIAAGPSNNLAAGDLPTNIYPSLDDALSSVLPVTEPSAPDAEDSEEDNANVVLPSYDDVMSGKV